VVFQRSAPLRALFRRATELGILVGGAERTTQLFGWGITHRYQEKLQTVLDRRNEGQPILRSSYHRSFVKPYEKGDRLRRTETGLNDTHDLRRPGDGPAPGAPPGALAALARPVVAWRRVASRGVAWRRRVPGLKLEDDRVLRLLQGLLHPGTCVADWTTREVHPRLLTRPRLAEAAYRLGQRRYDLGQLRAHGLVERLGTSRRSRLAALPADGAWAQTRGAAGQAPDPPPRSTGQPRRPPHHPSAVESAFRQVDAALDQLCDTLGLKPAA
jgi:hypothetical protein